MSHFTVLVVGDDVEGQLEPFNETRSVPAYRVIIEPDSYVWKAAAEHGKTEPSDVCLWLTANEWGEYGIDEHSRLYELTTYNPDSKWDWYTIGGRWAGLIRLKDPSLIGAYGTTGVMEYRANDADGMWVSQCRKGDIDWEFMAANEVEKLKELYAKIASDIAKSPFDPPLGPDETEEDFVRRMFEPFYTFAFLKNGEWFEHGKMGWFGISIDDDEEWPSKFQALLRTVGDDELLTVVDCHI